MIFTYKTNGVCAVSIEIKIENNIVESVKYTGGCHGNLQGIAALCEGKPAEEIINAVSGIRCGFKSTSCPDQLAKALIEATK